MKDAHYKTSELFQLTILRIKQIKINTTQMGLKNMCTSQVSEKKRGYLLVCHTDFCFKFTGVVEMLIVTDERSSFDSQI